MYCEVPPMGKLEGGRVPEGKTQLAAGEKLIIMCRTQHSSETINKTLFCAPNKTGSFELQGDNPECPGESIHFEVTQPWIKNILIENCEIA